jgi:hypothetical protein
MQSFCGTKAGDTHIHSSNHCVLNGYMEIKPYCYWYFNDMIQIMDSLNYDRLLWHGSAYKATSLTHEN